MLYSYLGLYYRLGRFHSLTGFWLLYLPCGWGIVSGGTSAGSSVVDIAGWLLLCLLGALFSRAGGCAWNDIVDRNLDKQVTRTASRPIASGALSVREGIYFIVVCLVISLAVWMYLPILAKIVSIGVIVPVIIYPYIKRHSWLPQLWLGLTFNSGVIIGWLLMTSSVTWDLFLIYMSAVFWTLSYDSIYAYQDRQDDIKAGINSLVVKLGTNKAWLYIFYTIHLLLLLWGHLDSWLFLTIFVVLVGLDFYIIKKSEPNDSVSCSRMFRYNTYSGSLILIGLLLYYVDKL